jgi:hypothetical protein
MSTPGFNAEASLYKTSMYYHNLSYNFVQTNKGAIQSAATHFCSPKCYLDVDTGRCVRDCTDCLNKPGPITCIHSTEDCPPNQCPGPPLPPIDWCVLFCAISTPNACVAKKCECEKCKAIPFNNDCANPDCLFR